MNYTQAIKMSIKSIMGNKMRSLLTMLGIIIGVCAVIIMISLVQGSTKSILDRLESMGTNMISVSLTGQKSSKVLTMTEMQALVDKNPNSLSAVAPTINSTVTIKVGTENAKTSLIGTNDAYSTIQNTKVQAGGRFMSAMDVQERRNVAMIGSYISKLTYPDSSPIGKEIKINGQIFTIIGVLEVKSTSTAGSTDDRVMIPYTTATRLLKNASVRSFSFQAKSSDVSAEALSTLNTYFKKELKNDDAFRVFNQADMLENVNQMTGTMTAMLGGIAGISLLVGGIGIMNIMLVSVTERTREIGIRKAIGARRKSILIQFLIESIVVSGMGGIIGIILGLLGTWGIGSLIKISATPSFGTMLLAGGFSVAVGIFFGWYPANKASKLNPIEALRFE